MSNGKITRKQYNALNAILVAAHEARVSEVNQAIATFASVAVSAEISDIINKMHDAVDDAAKAIKDLEDAWNTRNWTAGDWSSYALVAANID